MRQNIAPFFTGAPYTPSLFTPQTNGVTRVFGARGQKQQSAPFWGEGRTGPESTMLCNG